MRGDGSCRNDGTVVVVSVVVAISHFGPLMHVLFVVAIDVIVVEVRHVIGILVVLGGDVVVPKGHNVTIDVRLGGLDDCVIDLGTLHVWDGRKKKRENAGIWFVRF